MITYLQKTSSTILKSSKNITQNIKNYHKFKQFSTKDTTKPYIPTIFDSILSGAIPSQSIYSDELVIFSIRKVFNQICRFMIKDINPQAPTHILVIPRERSNLDRLSNANQSNQLVLGHMLVKCAQIAKEQGLAEGGFRIVINDGPKGCQSVYHLHMHIIGGKQLSWPPGCN